MKAIRRFAARIRAWFEAYDEWFNSLPDDAKAEIVRQQSRHM